MAGKFTVNVNGSAGQVIVGDHTTVNIGGNSQRTGSAQSSSPNVHSTNNSNQAADEIHEINNGYALVIHNKDFYKHPTRKGSEKDLDAIKSFCIKAGLTIDIQENLKASQIRSHCRKLVNETENKFSNYDGLACFILSHGEGSSIYGADDESISVQDIVSYFQENKDLLGKPKLFFIQACRVGEQRGIAADGAPSERREEDFPEDDSGGVDYGKILLPPESSDTLVAYSTIKGKPSFRHIYTGSWFIQTLIKQLIHHAPSLHVMDIMTKVNNDMSGKELGGRRQMPIQASTLTKSVYFKLGNPTTTEDSSCKSM